MTLLSGTVMGTMSGGIKVAYDDISAALSDDPARDTFAYNDANELTKQIANGTQSAYTYDDWGRTTTKITADTTEEYLYFAGSKLKTYKRGGAAVAHYNYDGFGKRRNKSDGSNVTWWRYDVVSYDAIQRYTDSNTDWDVEGRDRSYTYLPIGNKGRLLCQTIGSSATDSDYALYTLSPYDNFSNIYNSSRDTVNWRDHSPFNELSRSINSLGSFMPGDNIFDAESNMVHFQYREFSPSSSRWSMRDPGSMIDGPNMFIFAQSNPINSFDRLGLKTCWRVGPWRELKREGKPVGDPYSSGFLPFGGRIAALMQCRLGLAIWGKVERRQEMSGIITYSALYGCVNIQKVCPTCITCEFETFDSYEMRTKEEDGTWTDVLQSRVTTALPSTGGIGPEPYLIYQYVDPFTHEDGLDAGIFCQMVQTP